MTTTEATTTQEKCCKRGEQTKPAPSLWAEADEGYDPYQWTNPGSYVLSNGMLMATSIFLDVGGSVTQTGGTFTNSGPLTLGANFLHTGGLQFFCGQYVLQGGFLAEDSIVSSGYFTQSGGTNQVAGPTLLTNIDTSGLGGELAQYTLTGGTFTTAGLIQFPTPWFTRVEVH